MIDPSKVKPHLAAKFISHARRARDAGCAIGSTSEQIVAALLNGRADWLPESYPEPLEAVIRLNQEGEDWWHTMLAVNKTNWRYEAPMEAERL